MRYIRVELKTSDCQNGDKKQKHVTVMSVKQELRLELLFILLNPPLF